MSQPAGIFNERAFLVQGSIVDMRVDAIVNAANESLGGGGGVDGAIHRAAGRDFTAKCLSLGGCGTGRAKIVESFNLSQNGIRYVILTVGPVWRGGTGGEDVLLASCYRNSLLCALEYGVRTIAFPAISTGAYGYPAEQAARIALDTVLEFINGHQIPEEVYFCSFDREMYEIYARLAGSWESGKK